MSEINVIAMTRNEEEAILIIIPDNIEKKYIFVLFNLRSCLKLKGIFESDRLISLAKLGFYSIAKAMV